MGTFQMIVQKANTRDVLSIGGLLILGYGVYSRYFPADAVLPVIAMIFAFWFGKGSTGGDKST